MNSGSNILQKDFLREKKFSKKKLTITNIFFLKKKINNNEQNLH